MKYILITYSCNLKNNYHDHVKFTTSYYDNISKFIYKQQHTTPPPICIAFLIIRFIILRERNSKN